MDNIALYDNWDDEIVLIKNDFRAKILERHRTCWKRLVTVLLTVICVGLILFGLILMIMKPNLKYSNQINSINSTFTFELENKTTISEVEGKLQFVREMMLDSWNAYEQYAWGDEALEPVSKSSYSFGDFGNNSGLTLVASMSTLWIMELKEEFARGRKWIETELDLSKLNRNVRVHDVIVNYVGGLLSCWALTGDRMFVDKAKEIGELVEPAFETQTGIPFPRINLRTQRTIEHCSKLSEISGFQLDYIYLSDATGEPKFRNHILKIQQILKSFEKPQNLYPNCFGTFEANCECDQVGLFTQSREFYISLVKLYIQSNYNDVKSIEMYKEALDALEAVKMFFESKPGFVYTPTNIVHSDTFDEHIEYAGCYLGGMLALGANAMQSGLNSSSIENDNQKEVQNRINRHFEYADKITETCKQASEKTLTGLGPNSFYFTFDSQDVVTYAGYGQYDLSPELAESNFILWRLTHNQKYRDNAWQMAQAIDRHCRVDGSGYSQIENVNQRPTVKTGHQPAIFLSATLKYLYLTFTDDSVLPLDQFVFNSVGHPIRVNNGNS